MHYENLKFDVLTEMRKILNFFDMPISEKRLECLLKHKDGLFHREPTKSPEVSAGLGYLVSSVDDKRTMSGPNNSCRTSNVRGSTHSS